MGKCCGNGGFLVDLLPARRNGQDRSLRSPFRSPSKPAHPDEIRTIEQFPRRGGPNANRLRAKHSKGKKGTPKIVNVHNLCLPKLCHITMANVFLVFSFLLFCPALVQNVPVVWEPDAQTMFSESCLGAIDARMGCPRQSQQLNGLSTLPI